MDLPAREDNIIEYPENYEDMIKKLKEREAEQLKRVLAKRNVMTTEELKSVAGQAMMRRQMRATEAGFTSLKDLTILREPKSEEVVKLRQKIDAETHEVAKQLLTHLPAQPPTLKDQLKGRIKPGSSDLPSEEEDDSNEDFSL